MCVWYVAMEEANK